MKTTENYFDQFSDVELYELSMELQQSTISEDSKLRKCSKDIFGSDNLIQIMSLGIKLCETLAERMKVYSPYFRCLHPLYREEE